MWYAFRMDSFITSAKTKKELIANLYLEKYKVKHKGLSYGAYEVLIPDENETDYWMPTYYIFNNLECAFAYGFETQWKEHLELEALTKFLNDIESVAQKHGWNIGAYDNKSKEEDIIELVFTPALGYDSQFRKF